MNIQCALEVATRYGLTPTPESSTTYRSSCPVCGQPHLVFARSNRFNGYYFACNCYSQDGRNTGSGTNLDFWLRSMGAVGQAEPSYIPTQPKPASINPNKLNQIMYASREKMTACCNGADYLAGRGITFETAAAWKLGFGYWNHHDNQSITLPWYDSAHKLQAVSHRLIAPTDDQPKEAWQSGLSGKVAGLTIGWHTHQQRKGLLIVEGVLNAISVWQACHKYFDVLSPGSENSNPSTWNIDKTRWKTIAIWADKPEITNQWADHFDTKHRFSSQPTGAVKIDANDILRTFGSGRLLAGLINDNTLLRY